MVDLIRDSGSDSDSLDAGFAVVAAAATGNEVVKEIFMELKVDELILKVLNRESKITIRALYDAIRVLLTPDDNRVVASQVSRIHTHVLKAHITTTRKCYLYFIRK